MITKAIIQSIDRNSNSCMVRMPLFETPSSTAIVEARALLSITPGIFNNLDIGDIVFIAFEENAIEKPIVLGKMYISAAEERTNHGGMAIFDSLQVNSSASIPATTQFCFKDNTTYSDFQSPTAQADYIIGVRKATESYIKQLDTNINYLKNWLETGVSIDDGDLDDVYSLKVSHENANINYTAIQDTGELILNYFKKK